MTHLVEKDLSTKELIIQVTLELIKKEGFEALTVRKIASLAHINVALVNYHFGSKNKLLNAVIQILVTSFRESFTIFDNAALDPRERLKRFLIQYINAYHQYPFIARRLLNEEPVMFESQLEFVDFIKAIGLKKVQSTIEELSGESDPQKLTIMMSHLLGAVFLPTLIEPLYETVTGYPFSNVETQVDILLDRYFAK